MARTRRPLLKIFLFLLVAGGLVLVFLDARITATFSDKMWDLPAKVYARPLELFDGAPLTADDLAYWIESSTGILRRADLATDALDCPYFPSCADAVTAGGTFAPGGSFAQVLGASGALYVLEFDGATGRLYRILP